MNNLVEYDINRRLKNIQLAVILVGSVCTWLSIFLFA